MLLSHHFPLLHVLLRVQRALLQKMVAATFMLLCSVSLCVADVIPMSAAQMQQANIRVLRLQATPLPSTSLTLTGQVLFAPEAYAMVATPLSALVQQMRVPLNAAVQKGQVLAVLHSSEVIPVQSALLQAKSNLALAQQQLKREQTLFNEGIIAQKRVQEAMHAVQQLQLDIQEKTQLLAFYGASQTTLSPLIYVRAQHAGVVTELKRRVGDQLMAGDAIVQMVDNKQLMLRLSVRSAQVDAIRVGDVVQIRGCPAAEGRIVRKGVMLDASTQTQDVWAKLTFAPCLTANQYVEATVRTAVSSPPISSSPTHAEATYVVPKASVVMHQQKAYLMRLLKQGFEPVPVRVLKTEGDTVQLSAPQLAPNTWVAYTGLFTIKSIWQGMGSEQQPTVSKPTALEAK